MKLTKSKFFWSIIFTLSLIIFPLISYALAPQQVPNPQQNYGGWVTDMANILSEDTEAKLNQKISALEAKNGTEIAIVTVTETKPSPTPKQFTTELFNYWGIGKKGIDNGVLFLLSTGDRRVEIETGYGVEGILPDAKVGNIIDTKIIPQFKRGNFEQGIVNGANSLIQVLGNEQFDTSLGNNRLATDNDFNFSPQQIISLIVGIFLALRGAILRRKGITNLAKPIPVTLGTIERLNASARNLSDFDVTITQGNLLLIGGLTAVISVPFFLIMDTFSAVTASLLISLLIVFVLSFISKRILSTIGLFRSKEKKNPKKFICEECGTPMKSVQEEEFIYLLHRPQQVASQIGSIEFVGYKCTQCYYGNHTLKDYYLRAYVSDIEKFKICPNCEELTSVLISDRITKSPTYITPGSKTLTYRCYCCQQTQDITKITPPKELPGSSGSSSSNSSYSGGGSSGGGGSFDGGSSGGGGAGGDY